MYTHPANIRGIFMRLGLIGLGTISEYLKYGLEESNALELVSVCDISPKCKNKEMFSDYPFYISYIKMIKEQNIDVCYLATGAETHFEIASKILNMRVHVITEKPACNNLKELLSLYDIADKNRVHFEVLYHFEHGDEITYLARNLAYLGNIEYIQCQAHEQYAYNNKHVLMKDKYGIGNAWLDVGTNILSNLWHLIDLSDIDKLRSIEEYDKNNKLIYAHKTFRNVNGVEFDMLIDWMTKDKTKYSIIQTSNGHIVINHQKQIIYLNDSVIYKNIPDKHRMIYQYYNAFKHFDWDIFNRQKSITIMNILEK